MSDDNRTDSKLSDRLPPGFDPAAEAARVKASDATPSGDSDLDAFNAPQHQEEYRQDNATDDASAASFGAGGSRTELTHASQHRSVELRGDYSKNNGGGQIRELNGLTEEDIKEEKEREDAGELADKMEEIRQQERERAEAFLNSRQTFAGQTLTGREWQKMSDWFKDPENVADWEDAMMAETGQSREEVRRTGGKMKRFYELIDKQAQGKKLTADEEAELRTLSDDKDVKTGVSVQQERTLAGRDVSTKAEVTSQVAEARSESVTGGSNLIAARANLNAEPITPTYNAAAKDTPINPDGIRPTPDAAPVELAAAAPSRPAAAMNANLDMG